MDDPGGRDSDWRQDEGAESDAPGNYNYVFTNVTSQSRFILVRPILTQKIILPFIFIQVVLT